MTKLLRFQNAIWILLFGANGNVWRVATFLADCYQNNNTKSLFCTICCCIFLVAAKQLCFVPKLVIKQNQIRWVQQIVVTVSSKTFAEWLTTSSFLVGLEMNYCRHKVKLSFALSYRTIATTPPVSLKRTSDNACPLVKLKILAFNFQYQSSPVDSNIWIWTLFFAK
jgi:hypothetical protein